MDTRTITDHIPVSQQSTQRTKRRAEYAGSRRRRGAVIGGADRPQAGPSTRTGGGTYAVSTVRAGRAPRDKSNPLDSRPRPWRGTEMLLRGVKLRAREPRPDCHPASTTSKLLTYLRRLYVTT